MPLTVEIVHVGGSRASNALSVPSPQSTGVTCYLACRLSRAKAEVEQVADEASATSAPALVTFLIAPVALVVTPARLIVMPTTGVVVLALSVDEPLELAAIEEDPTTFGAAIDSGVPLVGPHR